MDPLSPRQRSAAAATTQIQRAWMKATLRTRAGPFVPPSLLPILLEHDSEQPASLVDAIVVDAEERWERGLPASFEYYAAALPGAAGDAELGRALLMCEACRRAGPNGTGESPEAIRADLLARFPGLASQVGAVMEMVSLISSATAVPEAEESPALCPGNSLGKYKLVERLGAGSFGEVWTAFDRELERYVALKLLHERGRGESRGSNLERFLSEARAAAALDHEHIVKVHDAGRFEEQDRCYIDAQLAGDPDPAPEDRHRVAVGYALDQPPGGRSPVLPAREAARVMEAICRAVAAAHARGVLHRDIKPANILLTPSGRPLVADFGLSVAGLAARETDSQRGTATVNLTTESGGRVVGTPAYMAPEQARGEAATPLTDVFALGATLRFLLTGRPPYEVQGGIDPRRQTIELARRAAFAPLREARPDISATLGAIADRAMQARPADRYISAEQMAADLRGFLTHHATVARPPSTAAAIGLWYRRNIAAASVGLLAIMVIAGGAWRAFDRIRDQRDRAISAETLAQKRQAEAEQARDIAAAVNRFFEEGVFSAVVAGRTPSVTVGEAMLLADKRLSDSPPKNPLIEAGVRHFMAHAYLSMGNVTDGGSQAARALAARESLLGPDAPDTLRSRVLNARFLWASGQSRGLTVGQVSLIGACERVLGESDPATCAALQLLAQMQFSAGQSGDAILTLERLLARLEASVGPDTPDAIEAKSLLAVIHSGQKNYDRAADLNREVADAQLRISGPKDIGALQARHIQGWQLVNAGRYEEADAVLRLAYEGLRAHAGPRHNNTLTCATRLATNLRERLNRKDDALAVMRQVLPESLDTLQAGRLVEASAMSARIEFAWCLLEAGRAEEAERNLAWLRESLGTDDRTSHRTMTARFARQIAILYQRAGKGLLAAEVEALAKRLEKPSNPATSPGTER